MRIGVFGVVALGLLTAACGNTTTQRSASGGLTGGVVGAIIGGPVGALAGAAAGAAGGWAMPEGADTLAANAIGKGKQVASGALNTVGLGETASGSSGGSSGGSYGKGHASARQAGSSRDLAKQAQAQLEREGLYHGPIDGIVGPETKQALAAYQAREGLQQTASLDRETMDRMNLRTTSGQTAQENRNAAVSGSTSQPSSGSEAPDANSPAANTSTSTDTGSNPGASNPNR